MTKVESLQKEIKILRDKLNTQISSDEKQRIIDTIEEKKRDIEKFSRIEKLAIPVNGPKVSERKLVTRRSSFTNNKVFILYIYGYNNWIYYRTL